MQTTENVRLRHGARAVLFDCDVRALHLMTSEVIDAVVDHAAHALQKLDARVAEMVLGGVGQGLPEEGLHIQTVEAARSVNICLFVWHNQFSLISTVNILFSNFACAGERAAMDVGRPMCRRRVPICTTNSSPFLNNPTSPFMAK